MTYLPSILAIEGPSPTYIFYGGDVMLSVMVVGFIYRLISQSIFLSAVFPGADDIGVTVHFIVSSCRRFLLFLCQAFPSWKLSRMKEDYSCCLLLFQSFLWQLVVEAHHGIHLFVCVIVCQMFFLSPFFFFITCAVFCIIFFSV